MECYNQETEGNFLNQFLEIISPGVGNIVTTNCIYYCSKFLKLLDCETIKVQETGKTSRGDEDLKLVERDVKVFITALIKHSLRVHLIYKRLTFQGDKNTKQNLGAPYISVCEFYRQVYAIKSKTAINGTKLYKEMTKNKDNKQIIAEEAKRYLIPVEKVPSGGTGRKDSTLKVARSNTGGMQVQRTASKTLGRSPSARLSMHIEKKSLH